MPCLSFFFVKAAYLGGAQLAHCQSCPIPTHQNLPPSRYPPPFPPSITIAPSPAIPPLRSSIFRPRLTQVCT
jgi:hypothetical protein